MKSSTSKSTTLAFIWCPRHCQCVSPAVYTSSSKVLHLLFLGGSWQASLALTSKTYYVCTGLRFSLKVVVVVGVAVVDQVFQILLFFRCLCIDFFFLSISVTSFFPDAITVIAVVIISVNVSICNVICIFWLWQNFFIYILIFQTYSKE